MGTFSGEAFINIKHTEQSYIVRVAATQQGSGTMSSHNFIQRRGSQNDIEGRQETWLIDCSAKPGPVQSLAGETEICQRSKAIATFGAFK